MKEEFSILDIRSIPLTWLSFSKTMGSFYDLHYVGIIKKMEIIRTCKSQVIEKPSIGNRPYEPKYVVGQGSDFFAESWRLQRRAGKTNGRQQLNHCASVPL